MTSENMERSTKIFSLAEEHGIPTSPGAQEPLEDSLFIRFREEYTRWAKDRDLALRRHLKTKPNRFRAYLPYTRRVFHIASQIVWYLDEIIILDPFSSVFSDKNDNLEQEKIRTRELIQFLSYFRAPIEQGYILFIGSSYFDKIDTPQASKLLLKDHELLEELKNATYCGYEERTDSKGNLVGVFQLVLDYGIFAGAHLKEAKDRTISFGVPYGKLLPAIEPEALAKILKVDPFDNIEVLYKMEIDRTIDLATRAQNLGAAVLFDKKVNSMILDKAGVKLSAKHQMSTAGVLNLLLPYISGIPPNRLAILRNDMPLAFIDFRGHLSELVSKVMTEEQVDKEDLRAQVERSIIPNIRILDAVQKAAVKKARLMSLGLSLTSGVGLLLGSYFDFSLAKLYAIGSAGIIGNVKVQAERLDRQEKAKGHPFYFLWKAKGKRNLL